jgi:ADP-ribose pyrophosphatase YjhB (NUDIX family)
MAYNPQRELIARAIVILDGAVLVNRTHNKNTDEDYYAVPGGHVEPKESCIDALRREFREELDAELAIEDMCFVSESIYLGRRREDSIRHEVVLYFNASPIGPLQENNGVIFSPEEKKNFRWLSLTELPDANLLPVALKEFLLNRNSSAQSPRYVFEDSTGG